MNNVGSFAIRIANHPFPCSHPVIIASLFSITAININPLSLFGPFHIISLRHHLAIFVKFDELPIQLSGRVIS